MYLRNKHFVSAILVICSLFILPVNLKGQNKYIVKVIQPEPVPAPIITSVTVIAENKNQLTWDEKANENIQYFNIYRDYAEINNKWTYVGKAMYPGNFSITDTYSFPYVRPYQYRISVVDKCGNEIFTTQIHKTIKLKVEEIGGTSNLLKWNPYQGLEIGGYKIYRGTTIANMLPIDTTSATATSFTDNENTYKDVFYRVEAIRKQDPITTEYKADLNITKIFSNLASNKSFLSFFNTVDDIKIYVYPNPMVINAVVLFPNDANESYQLSIIDLSGRTVYTKQVFSGEIEIERGNLKDGFYILHVEGKKIYKGKLIVGNI